ncbi:MAG: hypothetical protein ABIJ34_05325 [archaeon]
MQEPTLKEIEIIEDNSRKEKDEYSKRILANLQKIRQLDEDNKQLRVMFLKNKEAVKRINEQKIESLVKILNHKEVQFKEYQSKIKHDFDRIIGILSAKLEQEQKRAEYYKGFTSAMKTLQRENTELKSELVKVKFLMKKDFEKKILGITDIMKLEQHKGRNILKEYETKKLGFQEEIETEKQKNTKLLMRIKEMQDNAIGIAEENSRLSKIAEDMTKKLQYISSHSLGNEKILHDKINLMRKELEDKVKDIAKLYLDKEIEYKARVDSLTLDMKRYYEELRLLKEKYYSREQKLKEKISQLTQLL